MTEPLKADQAANRVELKARRIAGTLNACDAYTRTCVLNRAQEILDERDEKRATGEDPLAHDDPLAIGYQAWLWHLFCRMTKASRYEWMRYGEKLLEAQPLLRDVDLGEPGG